MRALQLVGPRQVQRDLNRGVRRNGAQVAEHPSANEVTRDLARSACRSPYRVRRRRDYRPRVVPPDRLERILPLVPGNPRLGAGRRIRGLRLRATDVEWAHGRGPEVTGPGEALLMAMTGRSILPLYNP